MLSLYDPEVRTEPIQVGAHKPSEPARCQPTRLTHTTACQVLFLMESFDNPDCRIGTAA